MLLNDGADELGRRLDFQAFRTPTEFRPWRGVATADQVNPEGVSDFGVSWCEDIGRPFFLAARLILSSDLVTQAATTGFSTRVSVLMT